MTDKFVDVVEVVAYKTEEVIHRIGPITEARANKVDAGMNINLDHCRFYTRIVDAKPMYEGKDLKGQKPEKKR